MTVVHEAFDRLPDKRKQVYEFYKLTLTPAGEVMKSMPQGLVFHPILPPYLIVNFITLSKQTKDPLFLDAARQVADQALQRATERGDASVFVYRPEDALSVMPHEFYSALTQSWYVKALAQLTAYVPDHYHDALARLYASLLIPIEDSGVLMKKSFGWVVEEYPSDPPLYTLNGWLTALRWVAQSAKVLDSVGIDYQEFLQHNLDAVEHLLPLYDAQFCWNTRYQLTGLTRVRVILNKVVEYDVRGFGMLIPTEGFFEGDLTRSNGPRWATYLEQAQPRQLQFRAFQSLISHPDPNVFKCDLTVSEPCRATILVAQGEYDPYLSGMPTQTWKQVGEVDLPAGNSVIECPLPFDGIDMFAYPTNFNKRIGDHRYNGYHFVHIVDLAELYQFSGREQLKSTALQWLDYIDRWPDFPPLQLPEISLESHVYGAGLRQAVDKLLRRK